MGKFRKLSEIQVRKVDENDAITIFKWRNMDELISLSQLQKKVTLDEHKVWFKKKVSAADSLMLIIELERKEIGLIRFDKYDTACEVSIYLIPGYEGKGYGAAAYKKANELANHFCDKFIAKVKNDNHASKSFFEKQGFTEDGCENGITIYVQ